MFPLKSQRKCDFLGPGVDVFTFASTGLSRTVNPQYMNKLHFKRLFKNPNFIIRPAKLIRQPTKAIAYILLQFNSFMILFIQIIHKKQTQTIKQTVPGQVMETHFSILFWRIPMGRGAWWTIVHMLQKSNAAEQLSSPLKIEQYYHLHYHCVYASFQKPQA